MRRFACAFAFVCLLATGCSLHQSPTAATSARTDTPAGSPLAKANRSLDAEVAMPAGRRMVRMGAGGEWGGPVS